MGYLGYFYIESKSFELRSGVGNRGCPLAEWSRGVFRSVVMDFQSMVWMLHMMEELMNGLASKEFCRSHRVGELVIILQKCQNHYGQFLEITEYGKGGRRSCIIFWGNYLFPPINYQPLSTCPHELTLRLKKSIQLPSLHTLAHSVRESR